MGAWEVFKEAIFAVIAWFYSWTGDWGMAIILITVLFRILIYPITRKQFKSSYVMQKMQPKIKELQAKYKEDPQRLNQETQKIYKEAKFNPLSGCLPMLLQMPIFIALYQVLAELTTRIQGGGTTMFGQSLPDMLWRFHPNGYAGEDGTLNEHIVSLYGIIPDLAATPGQIFENFGIAAAIPYAIMLVLFAFSLLVPMLLQKQSENNMKIMMVVMAGLMLWFGWNAPAGVLLYWDISSYIGVGQQFASRKILEAEDRHAELETIDLEPVKVEVERKERKARPRKKSN